MAAMKNLSERLAWARTQKGLSQQQLADRVGVAQSTIGSLEAGTRSSARKITAIAAALEVNSLWLAEGKGPRDANAPAIELVAEVERTNHHRRLQWLDDDEAELLSLFRACGADEKRTSLVVLKSLPKEIRDERADQR